MSATTPRQKAERCFAVARSTTHDGERENAIGRGLAICEREKLDPDSFDIPGRAKATAKTKAASPHASRFRDDLYSRPRSPFMGSTMSEAEMQNALRDALQRHYDELRRSAFTGQPNVGVADAIKRQAERERARAEAITKAKLVDAAVKALWLAGYRVYLHSEVHEPQHSRIWFAVLDDGAGEISDDEVLALAERLKTRSAGKAADWSFG